MIEFLSDLTRRSHQPPSPSPSPLPSPLWLTVVLMLGLAVVVYLPAALGAQFLDFDDNFFFGPDNPEFRDGLAAVLDPRRPIANAWLPIAHLSLWCDFRWFGGAPFWPHLVALLLHGITAAVLVRFVLALGAHRVVAHLVGAWFVVHPALAESVAWVSGRKDVLAGLFVFATLLQTVRFAHRPGGWRALALAALAALAMYSKATAVVLPLLAFLACLYVGGPRRRFLGPAILLGVTVPIAWHHQILAAAEGTLAAGDFRERLAQVPGAWLHYVQTTVWPLHLNVLYPEIDTLARFRTQSAVGIAVVIAALLMAFVAWRRPAWRLVALGLLSFFTALLPFNTAYPASSIAAADRYLYLAVPGAALAAVMGLHQLLRQFGLVVATALLVPMMWLAGARAHEFANDDVLWRSSLAVDDSNAVAHLNLVYDLLQRGPAELATVQQHLDAAVAAARYPVHELRARLLLVRILMMQADYAGAATQARAAIVAATAQLALETGETRRRQATELLLGAHLKAFEPLHLVGDEASAAASLSAARQLAPDHPDVVAFGAMRDLAAVVTGLQMAAAQGGAARLAEDDVRAVAMARTLQQALERHASHAGLLCALAAWEQARDRVLPALRYYRQAQAADPDCVEAWLRAARLLRERENYAEAARYARQGLDRRPDPALRQELALALVGQGQLDDAILQLESCLRVRPQDQDTARVLSNLLIGRAYARLGSGADHAEVHKIVERALAYNPKEGRAHLVLGRMAKEERLFAAAVEDLEIAHRLLPDVEDAQTLLAESLAGLGYDRLLQRDEDGACDAWLRCVAVAPTDYQTDAIRQQITRIWQRAEARGIERHQAGDRPGAIAAFRRCLRWDPDQHWVAWLLAITLQDDPAVDLDELEQLCRKAVAWQERHGLDRSQQVCLLAATLARRGKHEDAKTVASEYLRAPETDAKPQVLAALKRLADS